MEPSFETRLVILERDLARALLAQKDDEAFRTEMLKWVSEQRALAPGFEKRLEKAEEAIAQLERFRNKILGAVAVAGTLGGGAGGLAAALFQLLGGQ